MYLCDIRNIQTLQLDKPMSSPEHGTSLPQPLATVCFLEPESASGFDPLPEQGH